MKGASGSSHRPAGGLSRVTSQTVQPDAGAGRRGALAFFCLVGALLLTGCGQVIQYVPALTASAPATVSIPIFVEPTPSDTSTPAPATPRPTRTPTPTATPFVYKVQVGDSLSVIAQRFGVTVGELQQENEIPDASFVVAGEDLIIPEPSQAGAVWGSSRPTPTPITFSHQNLLFSFTSRGSLWVLGEMLNTSSETLEQVQVGIKLLDEEETVLAEGGAHALLSLVGPGESAPFSILFTEAPRSFSNYIVYPLSGVPAHEGGYYKDLVVESLSIAGERSSSHTITGLVRNVGAEEATDVQIVLTAYDALDRVVATRRVRPDNDVIAPGAETTFAAILIPIEGPVERVAAAGQGRRYPPGN